MPQPGRAALILLAALTLLGCGESKKKRLAEGVAADKAVAIPAPPTHFALTTADAKVELVLPAGIDTFPDLHRSLFETDRDQLIDFTKTAAEDRKRFARKGVRQPGLYERKIVWTITAISPHLISLKGVWFDDTGGAHPDHGAETRLWDRTRNQLLLQSELFKPDYDFTALDQTLCDAVTKAKLARVGPSDPKSWTCPKWADSRAVLVPGPRPYRIGALRFLLDPYVIGAYAEGDYEVTIPLAAFQSALAAQWAPDFTTAPRPPRKPKA